MKVTIEIPDPLFHRAEVASAQRRTTMKQLVINGLERELAESAHPEPIPPIPDHAEIFEIDEYGVPVLKKRSVPPPDEFLRRIGELREQLGV